MIHTAVVAWVVVAEDMAVAATVGVEVMAEVMVEVTVGVMAAEVPGAASVVVVVVEASEAGDKRPSVSSFPSSSLSLLLR